MKKLFSINIYTLFLVMGLVATIAGCKKVNTSSDLGPQRLFSPGSVSVAAGQTAAVVSWTNSILPVTGQKYTYTAQFSRDTTFATVDFTMKSDTTGVTATNDSLTVRTKYWVRVKTNATSTQPESKWTESKGFEITGEQYFLAVRELEIKETAVTLRFTNTTGLSKITLTPATGSPIDVTLTASDLTAGLKFITGLTANTKYDAELYAGTKNKGYAIFTTLPATVYTTILNPGDDLNATVAAAANGDVIGLNPGTYNASAAITAVFQKSVTIKSTSGNPYDTKVQFKELTLQGTGAGIKVSGIEFDGAAGSASYFINLTGAVSSGDAATFTNITVENCYVHNTGFCFIRANRGATGVQKIDYIKVVNTIGYDNAISSYDYFTLDKITFNSLTVSQCTFYNLSRSLENNATTQPSGNPTPTISFDKCTINNMGTDASKYFLVDANANPASISFTNCIIDNIPRSGGVNASAIRATASSSSITFSNNNEFNCFTTPGGTTAVAFPNTTGTATFNQTIDPGWTAASTDFTLPVGSALRTASPNAGPIGDPRWAY